MSNVIYIKLHRDLPTNAQNRLRYSIELGLWKKRYDRAKIEHDFAELDRLDREYELVGLP